MNDTTSHRELDQRSEQLIREHIVLPQRSARQALDRAFASAAPNPARTEAPVPPIVRTVAAVSKKRAPAEVSAVGERLYEAVCAHPGESMAELAKALETRPRELHRPMAQLRQAGQVRARSARL